MIKVCSSNGEHATNIGFFAVFSPYIGADVDRFILPMLAVLMW